MRAFDVPPEAEAALLAAAVAAVVVVVVVVVVGVLIFHLYHVARGNGCVITRP